MSGRTVRLVARQPMRHGGREFQAGDVFEASAVDALVLSRKRVASLLPRSARRSVAAAAPPPFPEPSATQQPQGTESWPVPQDSAPGDAPGAPAPPPEEPPAWPSADADGSSPPAADDAGDPDTPSPPRSRRRRYQRRDMEAEDE